MLVMSDWDLLNEFAAKGSEDAFRQLVEHYLPQVRATAQRRLGNDHLADDVTQAVFILLARKASHLRPGTILPGWLHRTTCFVADRAGREAWRRQRRNEEWARMQEIHTPDETW